MLTNAPWLQPPDFVGAMAKGASLGLDSAKLSQEGAIAGAQLLEDARKAAGQLGLGYAQNATHQQGIAAEQAKAAAELTLARDRLAELGDYRARENHLREKGLDLRELAQSLQHGKPFHVGQSLVTLGQDGKPTVLFDGDANKLNDLDKIKYSNAQRIQRSAAAALGNPELDPAMKSYWQNQHDQAGQAINEIELRYAKGGTPSKSAAGYSTPSAPTAPGIGRYPFSEPLPTSDGLTSPPQIRTNEPASDATEAGRFRFNPANGELEPY